jgi:uncharacterized protein (DUF362 family)
VARQINKFINLPVLKHHQSAGVTIALKNMSHGMVNNVNRSHLTRTANACGIFIPSVVSLPVIREKSVLHICDAVKASYHGGPGARPLSLLVGSLLRSQCYHRIHFGSAAGGQIACEHRDPEQ